MPTRSKATARAPRRAASAVRSADAKTPKTYRLSARQIAEAQAILGAPTATAAIEMALDMIIFRKELVDGTRAMRGVEIVHDES